MSLIDRCKYLFLFLWILAFLLKNRVVRIISRSIFSVSENKPGLGQEQQSKVIHFILYDQHCNVIQFLLIRPSKVIQFQSAINSTFKCYTYTDVIPFLLINLHKLYLNVKSSFKSHTETKLEKRLSGFHHKNLLQLT